jgi:hypothetical protein
MQAEPKTTGRQRSNRFAILMQPIDVRNKDDPYHRFFTAPLTVNFTLPFVAGISTRCTGANVAHEYRTR